MTEKEREEYCKNCDRSIFSKGVNRCTCDTNIENNGKYVLADDKCYCKIVNGIRTEKFAWEKVGRRENGRKGE